MCRPLRATGRPTSLLRDGRTAHIRPIEPSDAELLVEFYGRVSDESKYYRFFSPMPKLSEKDIARFTQVDHVNRVAFIVLLGGRMIAVGRYDVVRPGEAEVAFLVEDEHQGRGIAQLLLEHLAQAGRERGVERFLAEVLPDNRKMINTFRDAGYRVVSELRRGRDDPRVPDRRHRHRHGADGEPGAPGRGGVDRALLQRRASIAVIGASRREATIGQVLVRNLVMGNFSGRVYAVNPSSESVSGLPAYATVGDIPGEVDVAIVAVPADAVQDVVLDCAAKGVHGLVVISSGFAETGEEGRQRQRRLVGLARSYGLRLIGPNCLGIINTAAGVCLNASLSPVKPPRGRAGFFCQSGALGSAILEKVNNRGLGLSTFVSAGNRADVSGNDLLQYWEEDDATEVVLLYLESIGNPRKFSRIARRVSLRKPIIAVRSGRTTQGVPMGHAVRQIAAPPQAVDAMFRQAGVIQVDTLEEMFDVAQLLAHQPLPRGRRVAIVGNSDALGLLAADAAASVGLVVNKSVALGAEATAEDFEDALDAAIDDPDVDSVVAVYIPPLNVVRRGRRQRAGRRGRAVRQAAGLVVPGRRGGPGAAAGPRRRRPHRRPRLGAVVPRGRGGGPRAGPRRRSTPCGCAPRTGGPIDALGDVDPAAAKRLVDEVLTRARRRPRPGPGRAAPRCSAAYGIDLWESGPGHQPERRRRRPASASAGTSCSRRPPSTCGERPDLAHVWRNIDTADGDAGRLGVAHRADHRARRRPGFVVQKNAPPGVPVAIRSIEDPLFGPVVSFGISGPLTELLGDRAYRIPPMSGRRRRGDGARDQGRAAAVRLPRQRGRSTSPRSSG